MRRCISAGAAAEQRTSCKQCRDNPGICAEICDNIDIIDNIDKTVTSNNVSIINNICSIIIYLYYRQSGENVHITIQKYLQRSKFFWERIYGYIYTVRY